MRLSLVVAGMTALVGVSTVATQVALLWTHPIGHGSTSWSRDSLNRCRQFEATDPTIRCSEVAFAPRAPVGIGFSLRNTGPLPLTIVAVGSVGSEESNSLVEMQPGVPVDDPATFTVPVTRRFAPIDMVAGQEARIDLVGQMRTCDAVRGHWSPGTSMRVDVARITVRWLFLTRDVEMPLRDVLQIDAPADGQCR